MFINSYGFWWPIRILFSTAVITDEYIAYMLTVALFNLLEITATIYTAMKVRKKKHLEWWLIGSITNLVCKK